MPRMMGVDVPGKKRIEYALQYIHGIGPKRASDVLKQCKVDPAKKADDLTPDDIRVITGFIQEHYRVEGDLRRGLLDSMPYWIRDKRPGVQRQQVVAHERDDAM